MATPLAFFRNAFLGIVELKPSGNRVRHIVSSQDDAVAGVMERWSRPTENKDIVMHNVHIFLLVNPALSACERRSCCSRLSDWLRTGSIQFDKSGRKRQWRRYANGKTSEQNASIGKLEFYLFDRQLHNIGEIISKCEIILSGDSHKGTNWPLTWDPPRSLPAGGLTSMCHFNPGHDIIWNTNKWIKNKHKYWPHQEIILLGEANL